MNLCEMLEQYFVCLSTLCGKHHYSGYIVKYAIALPESMAGMNRIDGYKWFEYIRTTEVTEVHRVGVFF